VHAEPDMATPVAPASQGVPVSHQLIGWDEGGLATVVMAAASEYARVPRAFHAPRRTKRWLCDAVSTKWHVGVARQTRPPRMRRRECRSA